MNHFTKDEYAYALTKESKALRFEVKTQISASVIENILVAALEGQSNYWVGVDNTTIEWNDKPKGMPVSQYATELILNGKKVVLYDIEDENETWDLTLDKLLTGIGKSMSENRDFEDEADTTLQYALFGELVFA
jgi:hypothetical protein